MAGALTLLLIGRLLHGSLCEEFNIFMPKSIRVPNGSCVTIPCSFTIKDKYRYYLDTTCEGVWRIHNKDGDDVFGVSDPPRQQTTERLTGNLTGNLKQKDCTTTLNIRPGYNENTSPTVPLLFLTVSPQILPSSGCIRAAAQINCSCEMEGNPSPAVEWQMDGRPVNDSDVFTIRHEPLNATGLVRSFITINSQGKDLSTLVCHSTNSVGSARLQFYVPSLETSVENQGRVLLLLLIAIVAGFIAVTLCALLFVIRAQRSRHNPPKSHTTGGTSTAVAYQAVTSGEGSKVRTMPEEKIYINTKELRASPPSSAATISEASRTNLPSSEPHSAKGLGESSRKANTESDV
ncbi:uncharacterized protein LOC115373678 [Myripristis murdjan]|uniref:uncharacterized protein LOC115373678 n=1 Tax=Myripristis murdjan TaxID=586833 RepID=UPI001175ECEA|nr:SIGLEC family-like protein 1 [Myripristis murdjan]